jgi:hypothetical protein
MATSTLYSPIMDALLALLQAGCGTTFKTYSRRIVMWEALPEKIQSGQTLVKQPALYLFDGVITADSGTIDFVQKGLGTPPVRELSRAIVIYAQIPGGSQAGGIDLTTPGGDVFYPLIESVETALGPGVEPQGVLTLDGRVFRCWLEGKSYMFVGDIDPVGQGMLILPVKIMIP